MLEPTDVTLSVGWTCVGISIVVNSVCGKWEILTTRRFTVVNHEIYLENLNLLNLEHLQQV